PHHGPPAGRPVGERGDVGRALLGGVLQEPGGGFPAVLAERVEDADGLDAVAVPVAGHRDPVPGAGAERGAAGGARRAAVADVPGGRPLAEFPDRVEGRDRGVGRLVEGRRGDTGQGGGRGDQRVTDAGPADGQVVERGQAGGVGRPRQRAAEHPAPRVGAEGQRNREGAADGFARRVHHLRRDGRADAGPGGAAGRPMHEGRLRGGGRLVKGRRGDGGQGGGRGDQRVTDPGFADGQVVERGQAGGVG